MKDQPIKVGVIGVGSLGAVHARIYAQLDAVELVGVYDVDRVRAEAVAAEYGTKAVDELDRLADEIEAASVAVPTDLHFEVAERLIGKGVHLLVEKPIADTTSRAEQMVRLAEERAVVLQVGHVERFNPVMTFLEGALSAPRFIEAHRLAPYPPPRAGLPPRGTEVSVVLDLMIHDLDVILHLVGAELQEFHAVGVPVLSPTEDIANVRLVFRNGCVANVTASRISPERLRKIRVFQADSYLSLDYMNQTGVVHRKAGGTITREQVPIEKGEPLALELANFVRCVRTRNEPVVSGRHAADALRLAVAISRQIRASAAAPIE
ncbi:MAG: Gfo/Idh/MocA family oxidoreductase [Kiritimatiellae bacterium]|nr:Gfo/Idh/MocA family oxidoreductase [Kiritimatiellia bacterium]